MAKKHFDKYYEEICAQYHEMNDDLKEMEESVAKGVVAPEFLDKLKVMIAPIYNNWRTVTYIKFLLDMPTKNSKQKGYEKRNSQLLKNSKTDQEVINECKDALNKLENLNSNI